jgi:hypothetical protein
VAEHDRRAAAPVLVEDLCAGAGSDDREEHVGSSSFVLCDLALIRQGLDHALSEYLERATFVTGEVLHVDGGQAAGS